MTFRRGGGDTSRGYEFRELVVICWPQTGHKEQLFFFFMVVVVRGGGAPFIVRRDLTRQECVNSSKERKKVFFYYCERSMDPLLMSPVFTFCVL